MKNKNLLLRTLTCVVGIPLLAAIIFVFPENNYIALRLFIIAASVLGSLEISRILFNKVTVLPVVSAILTVACLNEPNDVEYYLALLVILSFAFEIKLGEKDNFAGSITRIGKNLISVIYPSYLLTFPMRFVLLDNVNAFVIAYYIILVFANDIFAYVFGSLFGKNNNAKLKASPKKSYAGFIGGLFSSIWFSLVFTHIFADKAPFFTDNAFRILSPIIISLFADLGDLFESVLKRCANVKDSSNLIPGHGGVLDRLDSIVATAPIFYFIVRDMI